VFWVILVYFNIRNTLPKSGTFLLGHPVYIHTNIHIHTCIHTYTHIYIHIYIHSLIKFVIGPGIGQWKTDNIQNTHYITNKKCLAKFQGNVLQIVMTTRKKPRHTNRRPGRDIKLNNN